MKGEVAHYRGKWLSARRIGSLPGEVALLPGEVALSARRSGSLQGEVALLLGEVALPCNPSNFEARIVGWLMGGKAFTPVAKMVRPQISCRSK
jgi:hypothetical protein